MPDNANISLALIRNLPENPTWYDVAAGCYCAIAENIMSEEQFLSEYCITPDHRGNTNPNSDLFEIIEGIIYGIVMDELDSSIAMDEALARMDDALESVQLEQYGEPCQNVLSMLWQVIRGIDRAVFESGYFDVLVKRGPLNSMRSDAVGIYLAPPPSMLQDSLDVMCSYGFVNWFSRLTSLRTATLTRAPQGACAFLC